MIDGAVQKVKLLYSRYPQAFEELEFGAQVIVEYRSEQLAWHDQWFSIREASEPHQMLLGGVSAQALLPDGATAEEFFSAPIEILDGLCPEGQEDRCGPVERLALAVTWDGSTSDVYDGQFWASDDSPGTYAIWLETAERRAVPALCNDVPPAWFQALLSFRMGR